MGIKQAVFVLGVACVLAGSVRAVEMLRPEDEALLLENDGENAQTVKQNPRGAGGGELTVSGGQRLRSVLPQAQSEMIEKESGSHLRGEVLKTIEPKEDDPLMFLRQNGRDDALAVLKEPYAPVNRRNEAEDEAKNAEIEERNACFVEMINACGDERKMQLEMEKEFALRGNARNSTAYLTQTLEAIGRCYQNAGEAVIADIYNNDTETAQRFYQKVPSFFVPASSVEFDARYCGESCSVDALIRAQEAKFADFRTYLYELIIKAPKNKVLGGEN